MDLDFSQPATFPNGTEVSAWADADILQSERPLRAEPEAAAIDTQTVASDGVTFTGLEYATRYVIGGEVGSVWRFVNVITDPEPPAPPPSGFPDLTLLDNFHRADAAGLGGNWVEGAGSGLAVASNRLAGTAGNARWGQSLVLPAMFSFTVYDLDIAGPVGDFIYCALLDADLATGVELEISPHWLGPGNPATGDGACCHIYDTDPGDDYGAPGQAVDLLIPDGSKIALAVDEAGLAKAWIRRPLEEDWTLFNTYQNAVPLTEANFRIGDMEGVQVDDICAADEVDLPE